MAAFSRPGVHVNEVTQYLLVLAAKIRKTFSFQHRLIVCRDTVASGQKRAELHSEAMII
jgi:hypothetical protein